MTTSRLQQSRRDFLATAGAVAGGLVAGPGKALEHANPLPRWKGFNFLDFFNSNPANARPSTPPEFFKWMRDWGFDFVHVPMAYPAERDVGFGLWEMRGDFGILDSNRADVDYEDWYGYKLDRQLPDLLQRV